MKKFTIKPLVLAMSVAALPFTVYAQDTQEESVEEVIVTGSFRDSLSNAMNIKRNQNGFVDAIVASDIAEFPDNNLAESLQRVPGVAISRSGGEGRGITVRGLGPTFTTVRLNGMETISTTGGTDAVGGNNRGRGFDFNTFSSDLFSSLTVRKTNSAEVQEGSLGATVDLKAAQPFDYDGLVLTAAGQLGYNDLSEENDPGASFLVSNTFADGTFGALFSLSYSERNVQDEGSSTVRWTNAAANRFGFYQDAAIDAAHPINQAFHPRIPRYDSYKHDMERLGSSLSLQWRPTETTELSLDNLWATFDATRQEVFLQASMNPGNNVTSGNVQSYVIDRNVLTYADVDGVLLLSENRFDEMTTDFSQTTLSLKQDITDSLQLKAMIGKTKSDYDNPIQNTLLMQASNQSFTYDYRGSGNADLAFGTDAYNKASWSVREIRNRPQATLNENDAASVSLNYEFTENLTFKFGADFKDFNFSTDQYAFAGGDTTSCTTTATNLPDAACGVDLSTNSNFIVEYDSGLGDGRPWLIPNRALIMESYSRFDLPMAPNYGSTYSVNEETKGIYAQVDFNFELGSVPIRGDIGVRRFDTDQEGTGFDRVGITYVVPHDYSDTLPALNLVVEPMEDLLVRFAYSEGIARAGLGSLAPVINVNRAGTNNTVASGNPFLEPTKAKSYDLGVEWYFGEGASVGLTIFEKDIESFVQTSRVTTTYTALMETLGLSEEAMIAACGAAYPATCNADSAWNYSVPFNSPGGDLSGYEISYQQPFTFLPGVFSNFGFIGSYTSVDADMDYLDVTGLIVLATKPLIDLSDETTSATLYYEDDAFSGRVSIVTRSEYLTTPIGRDGSDEEGTNGTTNVDASFGYQLNDSLKFTLEALNLTDEADDQWVSKDGQKMLSYYHTTGRQFNLGVQYKY